MKFDNVTTEKCNVFRPCDPNGSGTGSGGTNPNCADPDYRATHPGECGSDDPQCADPLFALANPTLCPLQPRLILKPSAAVVEVLQEAQYQAFLFLNGEETEISSGVLYTSSNNNVALVSLSSGNAIGVSPGIASVIATYGDLTAQAEIRVIAAGACATKENEFLMAFDVSKSALVPFGGIFSNRLSAAETIAEQFVTSVDTEVHSFAVMKFDVAASEVLPFSNDRDAIVEAIQGLSTTQERTSLSAILTAARDYFVSNGTDGRTSVLMLFSDGENNEGVDPLPIAEEIKESGIIIIVVGLRAKYGPYRMLQRIASDGFFINALQQNASDVSGYVNGLRQYLCSGNCIPEGNVTLGVGQLDFNDWTNWDVIAGHVDLIGRNEGGPPLFDLLPGNGLYMDDHGSSEEFPGQVRSKTAFELVIGQQYRLTMSIAGHNRTDIVSQRQTLVQFGSYIDELVTRTAAQGFTDKVWTFTATETGPHKIFFAGQDVGEKSFGNLIGYVLFENVTTDTVLLEDGFDAENPRFIPPACGTAFNEGEYSYGYYCYQSCLDGPIPAQIPDPNPLPNVEGDTDATIFTGIAEAKYCCPTDLTICATRVATATSSVSQADADMKAYAAALLLATEAVDCP